MVLLSGTSLWGIESSGCYGICETVVVGIMSRMMKPRIVMARYPRWACEEADAVCIAMSDVPRREFSAREMSVCIFIDGVGV